MPGMMNPQPKQDALLDDIKRAFGPVSSTPQTLEQQLKSLSESELNLVLTTAQMVKIAHGFTRNNTEPYSSLVATMYPRMNARLRKIIAEMLEGVDPVPAAAPKPSRPQATDVQEALLSSYEAVLQERSTPSSSTSNEARTFVDTQQAPQSDNDDFLARLTQSESSGDSNAEITIKDGRRFVGSLQFGAARLADYKSATGKRFTQDQFKADPALQDEVAQWHFKDIDNAIDALGDAAKGYDRDGLRSVAHLGGKGGMRKFVKSGGQYNPEDELGTSLKAYYDKFSSKT